MSDELAAYEKKSRGGYTDRFLPAPLFAGLTHNTIRRDREIVRLFREEGLCVVPPQRYQAALENLKKVEK